MDVLGERPVYTDEGFFKALITREFVGVHDFRLFLDNSNNKTIYLLKTKNREVHNFYLDYCVTNRYTEGLTMILLYSCVRDDLQLFTAVYPHIDFWEQQNLFPIFHYVIEEGYTDILDFLIKNEFNFDRRFRGSYSLTHACRTNQLDIVDRLLKHGLNANHYQMNADYTEKEYLFAIAARNSSVDIIVLLLLHGADIHIDAPTFWMEALMSGDLKKIDYFNKIGCPLPENMIDLYVRLQYNFTTNFDKHEIEVGKIDFIKTQEIISLLVSFGCEVTLPETRTLIPGLFE